MDHEEAVRQKMTEKYLLDELDPAAREQFEEHFFDCSHCALDVRAGVTFVDHSKVVLAEKPVEVRDRSPRPLVRNRFAWWRWLAAPAFALLLAVIAYQNLVTYPRLRQAADEPHVLPWATVNVGAMGSSGTAITTSPGKGFLLFVRIPPEGGYSNYAADLYNPAGKLECSVTIPATSAQDQWPVQVPGTNRESGSYTLAVRGITAAGESKEIGRASFELQIQK